MEYLIKVSAIVAIFYLCYNLFLKRDTFFESNRWFLIIGLITAIFIPLVVIPIYITVQPQEFIYTVSNLTSSNETIATPFNWLGLLTTIYFFGVSVFVARLLIQVYSLVSLIIRNKKQRSGKFIHVEVEDNISPFSFFNWIVFNPNQFKQTELEQIITHEKVHANQFHSIDILLIQIASVVFWCNPLIWLYKKELHQNLEFIADNETQKQSSCEKSYQHLLLKTSMPNYQMALTNNFYNSSIKKRIVMLHKSKSNKLNALKYALILPLLALFIMSFNTREIYIEKELSEKITLPEITVIETLKAIISKDSKEADLDLITSNFKKASITLKITNIKRNENDEIIAIKIEAISGSSNANFNINSDEPIKTIKIIVDNETNNISIGNRYNPQFKRSKDGSHKIHSTGKGENIYIFESEDKDNLDSIVITKRDGNEHKAHRLQTGNSFVIIGDGIKTDSIHVIIKGKTGVNTKGYIHKKGNVKIWTEDDGKVYEFKTIEKSKNTLYIGNNKNKQPLIIVDGKEIPKDEINTIEPNNIKSINVLKGKAATKLYSTKGEDGVIEIYTKKAVSKKSKLSYEVSKVQYIDDEDGSKDGTIFYISKNTVKQTMNRFKFDLKALNINVKYSKIKRNKAGEIIRMKISLSDNNGKKVSGSFQDTEGISNIAFGIVEGKLVVKSSDLRY